ncbi:MAG: type II toxin-antitoxin system VapC family toxin [Treponema sp.]|nr:type II toxin-antitoxin system VapC family toxin [Treponema sp.]
MICALDTNIVSYILRGEKGVRERWIHEENLGRRTILPLITYYEVKRGLLAAMATTKLALFEEICGMLEVDPLTAYDMDIAANIYAKHKRLGRPIDAADLLIAAQCISNDYTLVTHNTRHFEGIDGLRIEDWVKP